MSTHLSIQTTQNVTLEFLPASIGDRILAFLIDLVIMGAWLILGSLLFSTYLTTVVENTSVLFAIYMLVIALPVMSYSLLSEIFMNGQSVGKRVLGLRVVRLNGTSASVGDYFLRWLLRMLDIWIFSGLVGLITMAIYQGQRLGDRAAKTAVVKLRPPVRLDELTQDDHPEYQVLFPQALLLSDRDLNTIRRVLRKTQQHHTFDLLAMTAQRVKDVTGIQTDLDDWVFLTTLLQDHTVLAVRESV